jgi:hypothetical protein
VTGYLDRLVRRARGEATGLVPRISTRYGTSWTLEQQELPGVLDPMPAGPVAAEASPRWPNPGPANGADVGAVRLDAAVIESGSAPPSAGPERSRAVAAWAGGEPGGAADGPPSRLAGSPISPTAGTTAAALEQLSTSRRVAAGRADSAASAARTGPETARATGVSTEPSPGAAPVSRSTPRPVDQGPAAAEPATPGTTAGRPTHWQHTTVAQPLAATPVRAAGRGPSLPAPSPARRATVTEPIVQVSIGRVEVSGAGTAAGRPTTRRPPPRRPPIDLSDYLAQRRSAP